MPENSQFEVAGVKQPTVLRKVLRFFGGVMIGFLASSLLGSVNSDAEMIRIGPRFSGKKREIPVSFDSATKLFASSPNHLFYLLS